MAEYDYDNDRRNYTKRRSQHDPKLATGGTGQCNGDSGSPLVKWARTKKGFRAYVIGLVSRGPLCAWADEVAYHTRLLLLDSLITIYHSI